MRFLFICDDKTAKGVVVLCKFYMRVLYFPNSLTPYTEFHPHGTIWKVRIENNLRSQLWYGFQGAFYHTTHNHSINSVDIRIKLYLKKQTKLAKISFTPGRYTSHTTAVHEIHNC
jgi:hypothetical protein